MNLMHQLLVITARRQIESTENGLHVVIDRFTSAVGAPQSLLELFTKIAAPRQLLEEDIDDFLPTSQQIPECRSNFFLGRAIERHGFRL